MNCFISTRPRTSTAQSLCILTVAYDLHCTVSFCTTPVYCIGVCCWDGTLFHCWTLEVVCHPFTINIACSAMNHTGGMMPCLWGVGMPVDPGSVVVVQINQGDIAPDPTMELDPAPHAPKAVPSVRIHETPSVSAQQGGGVGLRVASRLPWSIGHHCVLFRDIGVLRGVCGHVSDEQCKKGHCTMIINRNVSLWAKSSSKSSGTRLERSLTQGVRHCQCNRSCPCPHGCTRGWMCVNAMLTMHAVRFVRKAYRRGLVPSRRPRCRSGALRQTYIPSPGVACGMVLHVCLCSRGMRA